MSATSSIVAGREGARYPAVMFVTDDDTRCDPMHARKLTAALRFARASGNPITLRYDTEIGHTSTRPVDAMVGENADALASCFHELDVTAAREG